MTEPLVRELARAQARLNAAIALHRALIWIAPAAAGAGLLVAGAGALGLRAAPYPLWAAIVVAAAAAGAFTARASFLDEGACARWLDERLTDDELLSAALACLRRGAGGRFDAEIVARAEALLPEAARLKPPRRPLMKRGGIAAAALAIGAYLLLLSGTSSASIDAAQARARANARPAVSKSPNAATALAEGGRAAADFASSLFPDDRRMATLTERALREGRVDDLRGLLKSAGLELDSKLAGPLSEGERKKLARERERLGDAAAALSMAARGLALRGGVPDPRGGSAGDDLPSDGRGGDGRGGDGRGGDGGRAGGQGSRYGDSGEGGDGRGSQGSGPRGGSPNAARGDGSGSEGSSGDGSGGGDRGAGGRAEKGGKGYGVGSGSAGDWGRIQPASGAGTMTLAAPKNPAYFELVLPGSEASSPVSSLAPASGRSAEAAMSREGLPLEYEDFVRSYFLALSKGESR